MEANNRTGKQKKRKYLQLRCDIKLRYLNFDTHAPFSKVLHFHGFSLQLEKERLSKIGTGVKPCKIILKAQVDLSRFLLTAEIERNSCRLWGCQKS
ncbi:CLUMA_CG021131, isoform A [Clunio marinus]|uniref:CLUMA_CG021131, isoform A n=1 Tax=Clunio marinus TaxID=568069 RepID=A0A1J1J6G8_9DIPT|nr:CLUMA_CG021131, isoform A [Clunio marinus]